MAAAGTTRPDVSLDRVRDNVRAEVLRSPTAPCHGLPGSAAADLDARRPDGTWADVDYADVSPGRWKADVHLLRLERIARAFYADHQGPADVPARLAGSLGWWLDRDLRNPNWWFNEIEVPREVGYVLTLMGPDAPPTLRARGAAVMARADWRRQTGANLVDETWVGVLRGCVSDDPAVVAENFGRTWQELRIVGPREEGIQADGSFHQHGPLLYNGGYGTVLLNGVVRFLAAADGTPYRPPAEALAAVNRFDADGNAWMIRGPTWDWGVCGRSICRPGGTSDLSIRQALAALAPYPGIATVDLSAAGPVGNRHFWCSDYMVQRRPGYFASIRMYSTRTASTDAVTNGENLKSHHVADGATCLMRTGDEYLGIYPAWDWLRVPGTTVEQGTSFPPKSVKRVGPTSFVGGCSDGSLGCAAMDLARGKLAARKAWFCFDHAIVCLGAGVTCDTPNPVLTTLNQCRLRGPVDTSAGPASAADRRLANPSWVWHDGIGYLFPMPAAVDLRIGPQPGAWSQIGIGSPTPLSEPVFDLAVEHGAGVHDGAYAYVLLPDTTARQTAAAAARPPVEIVANTARCQAAWDPATRVLQAVFHEAAQVTVPGLRVRVDRPCLLILRRNGGSVSAATPLNVADTVTVSIDPPGQSVRLELPGGLASGSTVTRPLAATTP